MTPRLSEGKKKSIRKARSRGASFGEISKKFGISKSTAHRLCTGLEIPDQYLKILLLKQGASRKIKEEKTKRDTELVHKTFPSNSKLTFREKVVALSLLYWAEGTKGDLEFSNSDPNMIRMYVELSRELFSLSDDRFKMTIRIYSGMDPVSCIEYWERVTGLSYFRVHYVRGTKAGKLKWGMCRVRITRGSDILRKIKAYYERIAASYAPL